jgi:2-keto-4-pentenoate hydratase
VGDAHLRHERVVRRLLYEDHCEGQPMTPPWDDPRISRGMALQLAQRRERLAGGEKALGWKVAFGAPAALERLKIGAPLVGFLTQKSLLASGTALSVAGWANPVVEPEIAVHLSKDVPAGADRELAAAAIGGLGPAIEVVDADPPATAETLENTLAGDIFHRNVILGKNDVSRAGCVLHGLVAHVLKNGAEVAPPAAPAATAVELIDIVRHVADTLGAFGETLRAGHIIITGSLVTPLPMPAGNEFFFELQPIDAISVKLSAA